MNIKIPFEPIPLELRKTIIKSYEGKCKECGRQDKTLHLHHIIPRNEGGLNSINNLIPLCPRCHKRTDLGPQRLRENKAAFTCMIPKSLLKRSKQYIIDHDMNMTGLVIKSLEDYLNSKGLGTQ